MLFRVVCGTWRSECRYYEYVIHGLTWHILVRSDLYIGRRSARAGSRPRPPQGSDHGILVYANPARETAATSDLRLWIRRSLLEAVRAAIVAFLGT